MRGDMSNAPGPGRFVPTGLYGGSLARSAWKRVIRAIPSRRERCDQVGTSGYSMPRERSRTIDTIDQTVPTGRVLFLVSSRHFVPGYLQKVPTGRKPFLALRAFSSHRSTAPVLPDSTTPLAKFEDSLPDVASRSFRRRGRSRENEDESLTQPTRTLPPYESLRSDR